MEKKNKKEDKKENRTDNEKSPKIDNIKNNKAKNEKDIIIDKKKRIKIMALGLVTGFLSGLFASGGGMIAVPGLVYFVKTGEKEARAIAIFCILPMVLTSMFFYNRAGNIDYKMGILCGIGGLVGGWIGAKLLKKINDKYLSLIFIIFLIYAAILTFIK